MEVSEDYSQEPAFTRWCRACGLEAQCPTGPWAFPFHWIDGFDVLECAITVFPIICDLNLPFRRLVGGSQIQIAILVDVPDQVDVHDRSLVFRGGGEDVGHVVTASAVVEADLNGAQVGDGCLIQASIAVEVGFYHRAEHTAALERFDAQLAKTRVHDPSPFEMVCVTMKNGSHQRADEALVASSGR